MMEHFLLGWSGTFSVDSFFIKKSITGDDQQSVEGEEEGEIRERKELYLT